MKRSSENRASVHLDEAAYCEACELAEQTYAIFQNIRGHYPNKRDSHLLGKIGEIACDQWLNNQGIECHAVFKDVDQMEFADIVISGEPGLRIDVKTWSRRFWTKWGRCIAVQQFESLQRKADAVIWCIASDDIGVGMRVDIAGWSTIENIQAAPRRMTGPSSKQVYNYQIDPEEIRPLGDLLSRVRTDCE